jgi:ABC-type transport system substrate-binding protein
LKFDTEENKFVPDIASCDIKSLSQIECYLQNDVKWSNGEDVTTQDIILTFKILKDSGVNPIISSLLSETTIEEKERTIIFKNTKSDINFLNVLLQPIVSTSVINNLSPEQLDGKFPTT